MENEKNFNNTEDDMIDNIDNNLTVGDSDGELTDKQIKKLMRKYGVIEEKMKSQNKKSQQKDVILAKRKLKNKLMKAQRRKERAKR